MSKIGFNVQPGGIAELQVKVNEVIHFVNLTYLELQELIELATDTRSALSEEIKNESIRRGDSPSKASSSVASNTVEVVPGLTDIVGINDVFETRSSASMGHFSGGSDTSSDTSSGSDSSGGGGD